MHCGLFADAGRSPPRLRRIRRPVERLIITGTRGARSDASWDRRLGVAPTNSDVQYCRLVHFPFAQSVGVRPLPRRSDRHPTIGLPVVTASRCDHVPRLR